MLNSHPTASIVPATSNRVLGGTALFAALVAALGLWLALSQLAGFLLRAGLAPAEVGFWRLLLAGSAFALHALLSHKTPRLEARAWLRVTALAVVSAALVLALGLGWGVSAGLVALLPLLAALLAALWWPRGLRSLNALLVGVAVLLLGYGVGVAPDGASLSALLLVGAALAAYYRLARGLLARLEPLALYALALPLAAALLLPALDFAPKAAVLWLGLGLFALLSSYGVYSLYYLAVSQLGLARERAAASAEPAATLLVALLLTAWNPAALLVAALMGALLVAAHKALERAGLWRPIRPAARLGSRPRAAARALETQLIETVQEAKLERKQEPQPASIQTTHPQGPHRRAA